MKSFNVLDRNQDIHRHCFLEASAGTGKTYTIENIVVRLLVEPTKDASEPLQLEKILVVTFTREATRDLKARIRANIESSISYLSKTEQETKFDYLKAIAEKGQVAASAAKRRLEQALFCFDEARIFTIHGFCAKMLRQYVFEGDIGLDAGMQESNNISRTMQIVRNYFRTEIRPEIISPEQINRVLDFTKEKPFDSLIEKISKDAIRPAEVIPGTSFKQLFDQFKQTMRILNDRGYASDKIWADFENTARKYNGIFDKNNKIKPDLAEKIKRFISLFDKTEWDLHDFDSLIRDDLIQVKALDDSKLSKKTKKNLSLDPLHYPEFLPLLEEHLLPIIDQARNENAIYATLVHGCQKMIKKYMEEEEILGCDDLLHSMLKGLDNSAFALAIKNQFHAAIIDEFQDTDPVQWDIFRKLFLENWQGRLYLVGDPKQSIYAFRQADIYTYLSAAVSLGDESRASLDTNYRSQPSLVHAINTLFCEDSAPGLISLPRKQLSIPYQNVKAGEKNKIKTFSDSYGSVHFFVAEGEKSEIKEFQRKYYFPFIAQEIHQLCEKQGFAYNQCAILVKDQYQAKDLAAFLKEWNIPCMTQRGGDLTDSPAVPALREVMMAALHPRHESSLRIALGGKIIGWTYKDIGQLDDSATLSKILMKFYELRSQLINEGFIAFFQSLLNSSWHSSLQTVEERLLSQEQGLEFYNDLQQTAGLLAEHQSAMNASAEMLIAFLNDFKTLQEEEDERLKKYPEPGKNAVNILTMHVSKGLEYDIVFALGAVSPPPSPKELIPYHNKGKQFLIPADVNSELYLQHCEEIDSEKIRQLYVAITRAKHRLYLPAAISKQPKKTSYGTASPMDIYLAKLGNPPANYEELYNRINTYDRATLFSFIEKSSRHASITCSLLNELHFEKPQTKAAIIPKLIPPPHVKIPGTKLAIYSFTGLSKGIKKLTTEMNAEAAPHDFNNDLKSPHTLPSGSETGNLLHKILEKADFADDQKIKELVHSEVSQTQFAEWESVFFNIVHKASNAVLVQSNNPFCLKEILQKNMYRETEFLYPIKDKIFVNELEFNSGFLKGVIDLVFVQGGKYYIVDWKSNWLGHSVEAYESVSLESAMKNNDYYLQASVYAGALQRYLGIVDKGSFNDLFGGVIYVFLRGLDPPTNSGIYHFHPHLPTFQ